MLNGCIVNAWTLNGTVNLYFSYMYIEVLCISDNGNFEWPVKTTDLSEITRIFNFNKMYRVHLSIKQLLKLTLTTDNTTPIIQYRNTTTFDSCIYMGVSWDYGYFLEVYVLCSVCHSLVCFSLVLNVPLLRDFKEHSLRTRQYFHIHYSQ